MIYFKYKYNKKGETVVSPIYPRQDKFFREGKHKKPIEVGLPHFLL